MHFRFAALVAYIATIPAANWLIGHVGTVCVPNGPCVLPVGFGLSAPSGVLMVGLALVLRDIVHDKFGAKITIGSILFGALLSWVFSSPSLAIASGTAFLLSELSDLFVYAPLREKRLYTAVVLSGLVGSVVDSVVFLYFAFGTLDFITGQILGKTWVTLLVLPVIWFARNRCDIGSHDWQLFRDYGYGFTEKCKRCGKVVDRGTTIGN